jgi:ankyrin repeat protein
MRLLLAVGAKVNLRDYKGWTPLMSASMGCQTRAAELLLGSGADVHLQNNKGMTALDIAIGMKRWNVVKLLKMHIRHLSTKNEI